MTFHRPRALALSGALILAVGILLGLLSLPSGAAQAADPTSARAVRALVTGSAPDALGALPADFVQVMGYQPVVRRGVLVRPDGSCSSRFPLPGSFQPTCARHDLGYDLLRYAAAKGGALGPWARVALDRQFGDSLRADCGRSSGAGCHASAEVAFAAVRANSLRQGDGVPGKETVATTSGFLLAMSGVAVILLAGLAWLRRRVPARRFRGLRRPALRLPRAPVSALVGLGAAASLVPSVMPRPAWLQGVFTALLMVLGYVVERLFGRGHPGAGSGTRARWVGLLVGAGLLLASAGWLWSAGLLDLDPERSPGPFAGWLLAAVVAASAALLLGGAVRLVGAVAGRLMRRRSTGAVPLSRERVYGGSLVVLGLLIALGNPVQSGIRAVLTSSAGSAFFESVGLPTAAENVLSRPSRRGAVRVYVGVHEAEDAAGRAELAVRRLERRGGFERADLVLALPTGSGWVDPVGVRAVERRFGGDVATAAVQSTFLPSWAALMVDRQDNDDGARLLVQAVTDRLAQIRPTERPRLYLMGESLGVLAAGAIDPDSLGARMICGATWTGPPGGNVPDLPNSVVVANGDDPVVAWQRSLIWHRPASYPGEVWLPVVSYLATGIDTIASLGSPVGHGHRYGPEQGRMPTCAAPAGHGFDLAAPSLTR